MLSVPYSSMSLTRFSRRPVRIEAIAMTVETPMTIPRTVRALRNLCARMLSNDIETISLRGTVAMLISILRQRDDGIQARRPECRINAGDHSDTTGDDQRQKNISDRNRHR